MAIASYPITLKTGATYAAATKLLDIKSFPDLGGEPEKLETTTLSDSAKTYVQGIQDQQPLQFTANYDKTAYEAVKALTSATVFWLEFGTSGASGIFTWTGTADAWISGAGVNEVVEMTVHITPATVVSVHTTT